MSSITSTFFGLTCEPGKSYSQVVEQDFKLTAATLVAVLPQKPERTCITVTIDEQTFTLASLNAGVNDSTKLDIQFLEGNEITFSNTGNCAVDLIGNHVFVDFGEDIPSDDESECGSSCSDDETMVPVGSDEELDMVSGSGSDMMMDEGFSDCSSLDDEEIEAFLAGKTSFTDEDIESLMAESGKRKTAAAALDGKSKKAKITEIVEEEWSESAEVEVVLPVLKKEVAKSIPAAKKEAAVAAVVPAVEETKPIVAQKEIAVKEVSEAKPLTKKQKKAAAAVTRAASEEKKVAAPVASAKTSAVQPTADVPKPVKKVEAAPQPTPPAQDKIKTLPNGLIMEDSVIGVGPRAKSGKKVFVRYIGKLQNGKVFDSNTKGAPFSFKLGKGEVIKGWDIGIQGMNVGGSRKLTIPAALAYGASGAAPDIPKNAVLTFEVKLLEVKN